MQGTASHRTEDDAELSPKNSQPGSKPTLSLTSVAS